MTKDGYTPKTVAKLGFDVPTSEFRQAAHAPTLLSTSFFASIPRVLKAPFFLTMGLYTSAKNPRRGYIKHPPVVHSAITSPSIGTAYASRQSIARTHRRHRGLGAAQRESNP